MREDAALIADFNALPGFDAIKNFPFAAKVFQNAMNPSLRLTVIFSEGESANGAGKGVGKPLYLTYSPSCPQIDFHPSSGTAVAYMSLLYKNQEEWEMRSIRQDVRYAFRTFFKNPGGRRPRFGPASGLRSQTSGILSFARVLSAEVWKAARGSRNFAKHKGDFEEQI